LANQIRTVLPQRVIRTIKEVEVYLSDYQSYEEARERIGEFIDSVYNQRIHSSLGYLTPSEFEEKWQGEQTRLTQKTGKTQVGKP
jgi:transposase InsO family protein